MVDTDRIDDALVRYEADHEFARQVLLPVEDQLRYGLRHQQTGYRWFRSPNIVDLEKYRRLKIARRD
jgi:hypothetical protein